MHGPTPLEQGLQSVSLVLSFVNCDYTHAKGVGLIEDSILKHRKNRSEPQVQPGTTYYHLLCFLTVV